MAYKRDLATPLAVSEFDDNKPEIRRDTTGRGKKRSVKVTGRGEDKVKKVYKKGKLVKNKKGTVISNVQKERKKIQERRLETLKAKDEAIKKRKIIQKRKKNEKV